MMRTCVLATLAIFLVLPVSADDNWPQSGGWPQFRGPTGDGHSTAADLPLTWSPTKNVAWKTPIHDRGWSSPVIWQNQIWLTTATADGRSMFAVCVDRDSGKIVHDVKVFGNEKLAPVAAMNSYASPTPVIEAGRVYVHFGTYGTACLDTSSAKVLWTRRDLNCDHHEGPGSSPILCGNLFVVHVDGRDVQYVIALDKTNGRTVWKTNRTIDYSQFRINLRKAFCTPILIQADGRQQLVSPGPKAVMGYDPATGEELWKLRYNGWSIAPRPVFGHGLAFVITDYERPELWAIRPEGRGELSGDHVAWKITKGMPSRPSLLLIGDLLFMVTSDGIALCVEAKTGRIVWKERLGGDYSASPIEADGRVYFFNQRSVCTVIESRRQFKVLASNELDGDQMMASPAAVGKALFVRTKTALYRIEKRE